MSLGQILTDALRDFDSRQLHRYGRDCAAELPGIQAKLVRWNDIVSVALDFYPSDPRHGVVECLQSCVPGDPMYDGKSTLAASLRANYGWMLS